MTRGDVYWFDLEPTIGSELRKTRPCVVVQRITSDSSPVVIVCPIAAARGRAGNLLNPAIPAGIAGMTKESRVAVHQLRSVDKARIVGAHAGSLA